MRILFMGTPRFAVSCLSALAQSGSDIVGVVTRPDRPAGRGGKVTPPPVKNEAIRLRAPLYQPASANDVRSIVERSKPGLIVVAAFGMILPKEIVDEYFCVNVHASLLPKYRGASPIQSVLLNGESITGITIIQMNERMDAGPVISSAQMSIGPDETFGELHDRLMVMAEEQLLTVIRQMGKDTIHPWSSVTSTPQSEADASYCRKLSPSDGCIDWTQSADRIHDLVRSLSPSPGAFTMVDGVGRVKVLRTHLENGQLVINDVQPEGKRRMAYRDYLNGYAPLPMK